MNLKSKLADLFRATERAHISAHNHTKDESPDWSFWFAEKLQAPLRSEFKIKLTKSEIVHCLMQSEMEHLARAPQDDWAEFYAAFFLERHATGDGSRETLALYYYETCPFCGLVLNEIDRLGVEVDHRHVLKNPKYREDLIEARGRGTVPVLHITSEDGSVRWLPESRDIVRYLQVHYG